MGKCEFCSKENSKISSLLGICRDCILKKEGARAKILRIHRTSRSGFNLIETPPEEKDGILCTLCGHSCRISKEGFGFCGMRKGKDIGREEKEGKLSFYYDPLPTNCVADFLCRNYIGRGYNLAIFFHSCSFNCLYCQNWQWKILSLRQEKLKIEDVLETLEEDTKCICFFGGDPGTQGDFALNLSNEALKIKKDLRICWETNGYLSRKTLKKFFEVTKKTGGILKVDLKAYDENLNIALTGFSNKIVLENIKYLAENSKNFKNYRPFMVSTLLVPGYVEAEEVSKIANFLSNLDPEIPYSILCFYPHHLMKDIPLVKREEVENCIEEIKKAGLQNFNIGNKHLIL